MAPIRFVHCADLHLGARFGMLPLAQAGQRRKHQREALAAAVDLALDPAGPADLFLIAGDSFDAEVPPPVELGFFVQQLRRLHDAGVRIFIIPGNHDRYSPGCWWDRCLGFVEGVFTQPRLHVHVVDDLDLTVAALPADPARSSLNLIRNLDLDIRTPRSILVLHATWLNFGRDECDVEYHPFSTDDLAALRVGYVALGHYHRLCEATPPDGRPVAFYPGQPEAIGFGPGCDEPGGVIVGTILDDGTVQVQPVDLAVARHRRLRLDATHESPQSLERAVADGLEPHDYLLVELSGTPPAETALAAEDLADRLQGRCAWLAVRTAFDELTALPDDNLYFRRFREQVQRRLDAAPDSDKPTWRRALHLGTIAFLRGR